MERDAKGRFIGSGNPSGRPKGARDKKPRLRSRGVIWWDTTANLGEYARSGGPGRRKGGRKWDKLMRLCFRDQPEVLERFGLLKTTNNRDFNQL